MAIITVGATGADYTSVATAISNSATTDTIRIIDNGDYSPTAFPSNITWGNLTFDSNAISVDDMPILSFTGTNYNNWWNNQNGTRYFTNLEIGGGPLNGGGTGTSSGKKVVVENCFFDTIASNIFLVGDNTETDRIIANNCIFRNCTRIFKKSSTTNNNQAIAKLYNCVFFGCTQIGDLVTSSSTNREVKIWNSYFDDIGSIGCDANTTANWDYNYQVGTSYPNWGINNVFTGSLTFTNYPPTIPTDFIPIVDSFTGILTYNGITVTTDMSGDTFPNPPDVGAFIFVAPPPSPNNFIQLMVW